MARLRNPAENISKTENLSLSILEKLRATLLCPLFGVGLIVTMPFGGRGRFVTHKERSFRNGAVLFFSTGRLICLIKNLFYAYSDPCSSARRSLP